VRHWWFLASQDEIHFEKELKEKRGFIIKKMSEDGACLFRAVGQCFTFALKSRIEIRQPYLE
jgi:hypothetical protein